MGDGQPEIDSTQHREEPAAGPSNAPDAKATAAAPTQTPPQQGVVVINPDYAIETVEGKRS